MVIPPFNSLRVLEAAVRLRSFASAAKELNLSPSAVSHRIRALEQFYGLALFGGTCAAPHGAVGHCVVAVATGHGFGQCAAGLAAAGSGGPHRWRGGLGGGAQFCAVAKRQAAAS